LKTDGPSHNAMVLPRFHRMQPRMSAAV
jgi:hypothetical protein